MRSDERGKLVLAMESRDQRENGFRRLNVEVAGGLIGQQQFRSRNERSSQSHALLLSAGKLAGTVMPALLQSHLTQPACRFWLRLLPGLPPQQQRHGNVFRRRKLRQQIVKLPDKAGLAIAKFRGCVLG